MRDVMSKVLNSVKYQKKKICSRLCRSREVNGYFSHDVDKSSNRRLYGPKFTPGIGAVVNPLSTSKMPHWRFTRALEHSSISHFDCDGLVEDTLNISQNVEVYQSVLCVCSKAASCWLQSRVKILYMCFC